VTVSAPTQATLDGAVIDLTDLDLFVSGRAYAAWRVLRDESPVHWNPTPDVDGDSGGFWALTRYADLKSAYSQPEVFSSEKGTVLGGSFRSERDTASGQMIICSDPPRHRLLRQQTHRGFEREMVLRVRRTVRADIEAALDRICADGGADIATELAPVLPLSVLRVLLGVDDDTADQLLRLSREIIGYRDDDESLDPDADRTRLANAHGRMLGVLMEVAEGRRMAPGDDLPSMLLASRINGRPMPEEAILYNLLNVVVGGNETTPYTACAGIEALMEHPDQETRLHDDPATLVSSATDEILRWTSTNAYVGRTLSREVELHGVTMPAGDRVTLWNASANRDERAIPDADHFDVARSPNPHLAFGSGVHRCIGQYVAREELLALVGALAERRLRFRSAGRVRRLRSNFMQGTCSMPLQVVDQGAA
jgi:cytochrome P450